jgi:REP element-mobilizing transposase RayT
MGNTEPEGRGYHSRGYLPHFDQAGLVQFVTFRLADAVPHWLVERWREDLEARSEPRCEEARVRDSLRDRLERYADAGHGSCCLRDPQAAGVVTATLRSFDGVRYALLAWVVMPNHVHVVMRAGSHHALGTIVGGWKTYSARQVNASLGRRGPLWQRDYYDRYIRDEMHLARAVEYTEANPVIAGLVAAPEEWAFSSASRRAQ